MTQPNPIASSRSRKKNQMLPQPSRSASTRVRREEPDAATPSLSASALIRRRDPAAAATEPQRIRANSSRRTRLCPSRAAARLREVLEQSQTLPQPNLSASARNRRAKNQTLPQPSRTTSARSRRARTRCCRSQAAARPRNVVEKSPNVAATEPHRVRASSSSKNQTLPQPIRTAKSTGLATCGPAPLSHAWLRSSSCFLFRVRFERDSRRRKTNN